MNDAQSRRVFSAGPSISNLEIDYATDAVRSGWFENRNNYLDRFTESFARYVGLEYVLPVAHCTDALHLSLLALGVGPGDEVIVPDLTWVASAAPILYVGARPVFVDVDPLSWCVTAEEIEKNLGPQVKAVIVVDLLGNMPDWAKIQSICAARNIPIIEDAAEGLGAKYGSKLAGSFGAISCFSFNATKLMMAGQGGALCTNDEQLFLAAKRKSHHGIDQDVTGKYFWSNELGFNYNWTNVQAAIALAQLERLDSLLAHKKWIFEVYSSLLDSLGEIGMNQPSQGEYEPSYWVPTLILGDSLRVSKEELLQKGREVGIDFRPMFYPLSSMPTFSERYAQSSRKGAENPVSYELSSTGICLPSGNELTHEDLVYVANFFLELAEQGKILRNANG